MRKWRDFLDGVQLKKDLESLIESLYYDLKLFKPRTLNEEVRMQTVEDALSEIKLKARQLTHENEILKNKIAILEEDLDLQRINYV